MKFSPVESLALPQKPIFFTQNLASLAATHPDQPCMHRGQVTTAEKVWDDVLRAATWMQRNGIERGSVVLFSLSADHAVTQTLLMAAAHAGATVTLVPSLASEERFVQISYQVSPACIFLDAGTAMLHAHFDSTLTVWMTPGLNKSGWDEVELEEIFATRPAWGMPFPGQTDDTALLLYNEEEGTPADSWTHRRLGEHSKAITGLPGFGGLSLAA